MAKYRKKPVVIEAKRYPTYDLSELADWCGGALTAVEGKTYIVIPTLEGSMRAEMDDWIIKGVEGEFYPCKPHIFDATYEPHYD